MVKQLNVSLHGLESLRLIAWGIVIVLLSLIAYVKTAHAFEDRSVHHHDGGAAETHTTQHAMTHVR